MHGTKVHKTLDYYTLSSKSHSSDLFSNVIILIFQYKLSITINYVLCNYGLYQYIMNITNDLE